MVERSTWVDCESPIRSICKGLCNNYLEGGGGGGWEMSRIRLKIKRTPPLTKRKLTLTSPHLLIILRSPPPPNPMLPPLIGSLTPNLHVGCLPQAQKVLQMTLQHMSSLHWNHLTLILKLCRLHTSYKILPLLEHPWQHSHVHG